MKQLGYVKETQRIDIEKQVQMIFQIWDTSKTGTVNIDEIVHGLIAIGLGGSPEFTKNAGFNMVHNRLLLEHLKKERMKTFE